MNYEDIKVGNIYTVFYEDTSLELDMLKVFEKEDGCIKTKTINSTDIKSIGEIRMINDDSTTIKRMQEVKK